MFNVGDKVRFGRGQLVEVKAVDCENYTILLNSGKEMTVRHELCHKDYPDAETGLATNRQLSMQYYPVYVYEIYSDFMDGKFDMMPDYQRGVVWDGYDRVALIESILMNANIGNIVLVHRDDSSYFEDGKAWEVLDGANRIWAIANYINNKYSVNGYYFDDLSKADRYAIENHTVGVARMSELSRRDKLNLFLLTNRSGKPMAETHIEKVKEMLKGC